jgi:BirA family biotin operon repressor/biotin-[acetyl-CoA-carboxylase] ligase
MHTAGKRRVLPVRAAGSSGRSRGETIEVRLDQQSLQGRFVALEEDGALSLELPQGERRRVTVGDVFFRR